MEGGAWAHPAGAPKPVELDFTFGSGASQILKGLVPGTVIKCVTVKITTPFSGGTGRTLSIGFPADNSEIATTTQLNLTIANMYKFDVYRTSAISETLMAYWGGTATAGAGKIIVEFTK